MRAPLRVDDPESPAATGLGQDPGHFICVHAAAFHSGYEEYFRTHEPSQGSHFTFEPRHEMIGTKTQLPPTTSKLGPGPNYISRDGDSQTVETRPGRIEALGRLATTRLASPLVAPGSRVGGFINPPRGVRRSVHAKRGVGERRILSLG